MREQDPVPARKASILMCLEKSEMNQSNKKSKHILLALGAYDYRVHRGVVHFAREHNWHLTADPNVNHNVPWGWEGDGVIAGSGCSDELACFLDSLDVPVVDLSYRRAELKFPRLLSDNETIGHLAADHFLQRGFQHFLYVSFSTGWVSEERFTPFSRHINEAGFECENLPEIDPSFTEQEPWIKRKQRLLKILSKMPFPLAAFCATDQEGAEVIATCNDAGIRIPEEIAVLSVGNYDLVCESLSIPMSSIDNNQQGQGYQGAGLLDRMLTGETLPLEPFRIAPLGLITRRSSDIFAIEHPKISEALHYLHKNYHTTLDSSELAKIAGMSRQGFHKAFVQQLGRTPGAELRRIRFDKAKELLRQTDLPVNEIAFRTGWGSANSLCIAFKREQHQTPAHYRKRKRKPE